MDIGRRSLLFCVCCSRAVQGAGGKRREGNPVPKTEIVIYCGAAVGQFKELVESAEKDQPLQESLRRALNLTAKVGAAVYFLLMCL
jgi:hypothetical protein